MENTEILDGAEYSGVTDEIRFTNESLQYIKESAKWGSFLAIMGFIFMGLMVLVGLFFGSIMGSVAGTPGLEGFDAVAGGMGGMMAIIYIVLALLYLYPTLKLFQFSKYSKLAIATNSSDMMTKALSSLKSMFKFMGIFTIVILSLYVLMFIFAGVVGLSM